MNYDIISEKKEEELPVIPQKKPDYSVDVRRIVPEYSKEDQVAFSSEKKKLTIDSSDEKEEVIPVIQPVCEEKPKQPIKEEIPFEEKGFKYLSKTSFVKKEETKPAPEEIIPEIKKIPDFRVIGEFLKTYILIEMEDDLLIIDKHAAHERIIFEKLKSEDNGFSSQLLASPENIILTPEQHTVLFENKETVENSGFTFEEADGNEVLITGIPTIFDIDVAADVFCEIIEKLSENNNNTQVSLLDEIYHSMACKAAIKAHDKNNILELEHLAKQVLSNDNIRYCPHGRPVIATITERELEKRFKRVL